MIEIRKINSEYDGLRKLWCDTFGDSVEYVNQMYAAWGPDMEGYVLVDDNGVLGPENVRRVVAALTLFKMGYLVEGDKETACYVSYAICTDEKEQGKGYGSTITEYAKDLAWKKGGVSMLCPSSNKLVGFYMPLGYEPRFYASEGEVDSAEASDIKLEEISASEYGELREEMLADIVHVRLSEHTLGYIEETSKAFVKINGGKLIAVVDKLGPKKLYLSEVLSKCELVDIRSMLASLGLEYGKSAVEYRTVGDDYLQSGTVGSEYLQAMIASENGCNFSRGYFGFPFD